MLLDNALIFIVSIIAGVSTYFIANNIKKGPIFASSVVTLISGIMFPYFFPTFGNTLMVVAACSSYAGMVSIKNVPKLWEMVMVSAITASLFIIVSTAYVGVGGRLGTIAAIGCFTWVGAKRVFLSTKITNANSQQCKVIDIK